MKNYIYFRVSTANQTFNAQLENLSEAKINLNDPDNIVIKEIISSTAKLADRKELQKTITKMNVGETLTVTRLDRLARNVTDVLSVLETLKNKGCYLKIIQFPIDTTTTYGQLFLTILGGIADFERTLILEKTRQGIEAAKQSKKFKGGARRFSKETIKEIQYKHFVRKLTYVELQKLYNCSQTTLAKYLHLDAEKLCDDVKVFKKKD